jgi:MFS family permease
MFALLRQRNFALLWSGGLISRTGDWLLDIGLSFYVYAVTGSALATSIALLSAFVPGLLLGSFAGVFVDRWDRRWTMIVSNLVLALGLLPLLAVHSRETIWIAYIVLFFEACVAQFVTPAQNALVPVLVDEDRLVSANALQSIGQESPRLLGGALGGVLVGFFGLYSVTLLDAISFFVVCVMIWLIKMPAQPQTQPVEAQEVDAATSLAVAVKSFGREWLEGMQLILGQYLLVVLFIIIAVQSLGEGVFGVLLIVFVKLVLHSGAAVYGSLMSFQAIGNLAGAFVIGWIGNRIPAARMLGVCSLLFGILDLLIVDVPLFIPGVVIVMALFVLVGFPGTGFSVSVVSLFQSNVENALQGRIFGAFSTVTALMMLVGTILAGALGDRLGPTLLLNIQGGGYALSGIFAIIMLWKVAGKKLAVRHSNGVAGRSQQEQAG